MLPEHHRPASQEAMCYRRVRDGVYRARLVRGCRRMTLFELIVVVGLIGVLLAASAPSLRRFTHSRKTLEEARRLLAVTRHARSRAVSRGEIVQLWLFPGDGVYSVVPTSADSDGQIHATEYALADPLQMMVEVDDTASLDEEFCILWLPDGTYEAEGLTAVVLWSRATPDDQAVLLPDEHGVRFTIAQEATP